MDQNSTSRPKRTVTVPARLCVGGEAGAAAGFGASTMARQTPDQPPSLTTAPRHTAQLVNSQSGSLRGTRDVVGVHVTPGVPRLPGITAGGPVSSSGGPFSSGGLYSSSGGTARSGGLDSSSSGSSSGGRPSSSGVPVRSGGLSNSSNGPSSGGGPSGSGGPFRSGGLYSSGGGSSNSGGGSSSSHASPSSGVNPLARSRLTHSSDGGSSSEGSCFNPTFHSRNEASNAAIRMDGGESFVDDGVDDLLASIDVEATSTKVRSIAMGDAVDCSDGRAGSGEGSSSSRSSPETAWSTAVSPSAAVRKGRGRKPGKKQPVGSYAMWTLKHLKAAGKHRGVRHVYRFGKNEREQLEKMLERMDEEKGRESPFLGDSHEWVEERGEEDSESARSSASNLPTPPVTTSAAEGAPTAQGHRPSPTKIPQPVVMAYVWATGMGATFSSARPFKFKGIEYSLPDLEAAAAKEHGGASAASVAETMPGRRKTKNCLPRLCNILAMDKYRHRLLLSKQPLSRADMDAKKVGSASDLWKEVHEDYVDKDFETGGCVSDAVQLSHIDPSVVSQFTISVEKLHSMWGDAVRAWNRAKTNFEASGSNSEFWDFCGGNTDVLYLHETFVQYPDLKSFSDAGMPDDMQREETGDSERTQSGRSGADADAKRRKDAKAKAVAKVATARGTGRKNKTGKGGDCIYDLTTSITSMMPVLQQRFQGKKDEGEGAGGTNGEVETERSKRLHDQQREDDRRDADRKNRAEFKELCEHVRYLKEQIRKEEAADDPDEFMISLYEEEMELTKEKVKRRRTARVDGGGEAAHV